MSWVIPWTLGLSHLFTDMVSAKNGLICVISGISATMTLRIVLMCSMIINLLVIIILYIFIHRAIVRAFRIGGSHGFFRQAYKIIFWKSSDNEKKELKLKSPLKTREVRSTLLVLLIILFAVINVRLLTGWFLTINLLYCSVLTQYTLQLSLFGRNCLKLSTDSLLTYYGQSTPLLIQFCMLLTSKILEKRQRSSFYVPMKNLMEIRKHLQRH